MPIDITQKLVSFAELARALPRRRRNRPVHVSTIHRWRQRGVDGVRLEAIRIGGAWHTSWEAFAFLRAANDRQVGRGSQVCHFRSDTERPL